MRGPYETIASLRGRFLSVGVYCRSAAPADRAFASGVL